MNWSRPRGASQRTVPAGRDGFELAVAVDVADATPAAIASKLKDAATALLTG